MLRIAGERMETYEPLSYILLVVYSKGYPPSFCSCLMLLHVSFLRFDLASQRALDSALKLVSWASFIPADVLEESYRKACASSSFDGQEFAAVPEEEWELNADADLRGSEPVEEQVNAFVEHIRKDQMPMEETGLDGEVQVEPDDRQDLNGAPDQDKLLLLCACQAGPMQPFSSPVKSPSKVQELSLEAEASLPHTLSQALRLIVLEYRFLSLCSYMSRKPADRQGLSS